MYKFAKGILPLIVVFFKNANYSEFTSYSCVKVLKRKKKLIWNQKALKKNLHGPACDTCDKFQVCSRALL